MSKMTFMDKLSVLLNVSLSSKLFIGLFILLIIIGIVLIKNNNNENNNKKIYLMITIFISALVIFTFNTSLAKMFDYMMNNFFVIIYFPNIAIYLAAIIATNIILFVSIISNKTSKVIKNLNVIVYTIINYLLVLLLFTVNKNELDLFSHTVESHMGPWNTDYEKREILPKPKTKYENFVHINLSLCLVTFS